MKTEEIHLDDFLTYTEEVIRCALKDFISKVLETIKLENLPKNLNDARATIKYCAKNWSANACIGVKIDSSITQTLLLNINDVLNRFAHTTPTKWTVFDRFIEEVTTVLQAFEAFGSLKSNGGAAEIMRDINAKWARVPKPGTEAFVSDIRISLKDALKISAAEETAVVIFENLPSGGDPDDFLELVVQNISDVVEKRSEGADLVVTMKSPAIAKQLVIGGPYKFRKMPINVRQPEETRFVTIKLTGLPDAATEAVVIKALNVQLAITPISVSIQTEEKVALVRLSPSDSEEILKEDSIRISGAKVQVASQTNVESSFLLYFAELPDSSKVATLWESCIGFSVAGRVKTYESEKVALVNDLTASEIQQIQKYIAAKVIFNCAGREVLIAQNSPHRIRLELPTKVSDLKIMSALAQVITKPVKLMAIPDALVAFVHLGCAEDKIKLLDMKELLISTSPIPEKSPVIEKKDTPQAKTYFEPVKPDLVYFLKMKLKPKIKDIEGNHSVSLALVSPKNPFEKRTKSKMTTGISITGQSQTDVDAAKKAIKELVASIQFKKQFISATTADDAYALLNSAVELSKSFTGNGIIISTVSQKDGKPVVIARFVAATKDLLQALLVHFDRAKVLSLQFSEGEFRYFDKFLLGTLAPEAHRDGLTLRVHRERFCVEISGPLEKRDRFRAKLDGSRALLKSLKFHKKVDKTLLPILRTFLAETIDKSIAVVNAALEKENSEKSSGADHVCIEWNFAGDDKLENKIIQTMSSIEGVSDDIPMTPQQEKAAKKLNPKILAEKFKCAVQMQQDKITVKSFNRRLLEEAVKFVRQFIIKGSVVNASVDLIANRQRFLKNKRWDYLEGLKQELSLNNLQYVEKEGKKLLTFSGEQTKVERAKKEIESILADLVEEKLDFDCDIVSLKDLREFAVGLESQYDVAAFVSDTKEKNLKSHFLYVVGPSTVDRNLIKSEADKIRGAKENFKPSDFDLLYKIVVTNGDFEQEKFREEWSIKKMKFDKKEKVVELLADNSEHIQQCKKALEGILENKRLVSQLVEISPVDFKFLPKAEYEDISKSNEVALDEVKKFSLVTAVRVKGSKEKVEAAVKKLEELIASVKKQIVTENEDISVSLAEELLKDSRKLINSVFRVAGIFVEVPNNRQHVVAEWKIKDASVQVVDGSIFKEQTDAIVNAANDKLSHVGGIAAKIAKKAGQSLLNECSEYIKKNGKLPTGKAVATTAGDLPFKKVIHTVGPVWSGGKAGEAQLLAAAVLSALQNAADLKLTSVSLPAISSGIFGFPIDRCCEILVKTATDFVKTSGSSIKLVRICDNNPNVVLELSKSLLKFEKSQKVAKVRTIKPEDVAFQWHYVGDERTWVPFDADQNYEIEIAYIRQNKTGKLTVTGDKNKVKNGYEYEIDFDNMTEINTKYRKQYRQLDRRRKKDIPSEWRVHTPQGLVKLPDNTAAHIEYSRRQKQTHAAVYWIGRTYRLDFASMTMVTVEHAGGRPEQPLQVSVKDFEEDMRKFIENSIKAEEVNEEPQKPRTVRIQLHGKKETMKEAKTKFHGMLKDLEITSNLSLASPLATSHLASIQKIAATHGIEIVDKKDALTLTGLERSVTLARAEIAEYLMNNAPKGTVSYPEHWIAQNENLILVKLKSGTTEWNDIEKRVKETLNVNITEIQRVQNKWLWEKYSVSKAAMEKKSSRSQELNLFHGTRNNAPSNIYNGQNGFDMRYGAAGMWGVAIYFAKNASYSHNYRYQIAAASGVQQAGQMFLARVLVGDSKTMAPDSTMRKPPSKGTQASLGFTEDYDSVNGVTGDSQVWMIYENGLAYPEYLISYAC